MQFVNHSLRIKDYNYKVKIYLVSIIYKLVCIRQDEALIHKSDQSEEAFSKLLSTSFPSPTEVVASGLSSFTLFLFFGTLANQ